MNDFKNENFIFRLATEKEIEKISSMYFEINDFLESTINYPGWGNDFYPTKETAENGIKESTLFVLENGNLENDDKIVATCILKTGMPDGYETGKWEKELDWNNVLSIHTLLVKLSEMKKGYSKILVKKIEDYAKEKNFDAIRLDCTQTNIPAKKLYNGLGYKDAGESSLVFEKRGLYKFFLFEKLLK